MDNEIITTMRKINHTKLLVACLSLGTMLSSCYDKYHYDPNWERPHCDFTFHTDDVYDLSVSYSDMGVSTSVFFSLYDQNPVTEGEHGTLILKEELTPIFTGVTSLDGTFNETIDLPSYLNEVYVYTDNFFAQTVIKARINGNSIVAEDGTDLHGNRVKVANRFKAGSTSEKYHSRTEDGSGITGEAWKTWLGEYDESTGIVTGFNEPATDKTTYITKRVQNTGTYALTSGNGIIGAIFGYKSYYYTHPTTKENIYVNVFYTTETGSKTTTKVDKNAWYDRIIAVTEKEEGTFHPGYDYKGDELLVQNYQELYNVHSSVINVNKSCPETYRSSKDLQVGDKDAEVAITLLGGNTCWTSSLGYYWYTDANKPTSYNDIKSRIVMIFPNTQDGHWSSNTSDAKAHQGVERGTCVQLKYYPNIASGSKEGETTVFPAGTKIGFVLATNTWTNTLSSQSWLSEICGNRSATSSGLSMSHSKTVYTTPRTAIYKYGENIMISFEDHSDDQNFSDVVFTLKSNPIDAFVDVVEVNETEVTQSENKGWYCYEDIWPAEGDYDLNDVVIKCNQNTTWPITKTTTTHVNGTTTVTYSTPDKISKDEFTFKTFQNFATYTDGVYCYVDMPAGVTVEKEEYFLKKVGETEWKPFEPEQKIHEELLYNKHGNFAYNDYGTGTAKVICFTNSIREEGIGSEYKVRLTYAKSTQSTKKTVFRPYICVREGTIPSGSDVPFYEVHIPLETPTNIMPIKYWSTMADASLPARLTANGEGNFYVRANNINNLLYGPWYPFAIKFSGATEADMAPLIDKNNESIAISKLYPDYEKWVESNGTEHTDWYKRTR